MEKSKDRRNIQPFNGSKYSAWKHRIRNLLFELEVLKVIDGQIPAKMDAEWEKAERIAKCVIVEYLSDAYLKYDTPGSTAKSILQCLDAVFERKSAATEVSVRNRLSRLKMKSETLLKDHFETFDDLITELAAAGVSVSENQKVSYLLTSLPTTYETVSTVIETITEDKITLDYVKTRLFDHETKMKNASVDTSAKALQFEIETSKGNNDSSRGYRGNRRGISRRGRSRSSRFSHRYNFKRNSNYGKCHQCGRNGHKMKDCWYYKKNKQYQAERNKNIQTIQTVPMETCNNTSGFAFMMTGNYQNIESDKLRFLLDSGASDHVINKDSLFSSVTELHPPIKISIAKNGEFIKATKKGRINVTTNLGVRAVLEDVLYCPEVPYNLLSVGKMQQAGMSITFDAKGIQINKNGKMVMYGKPSNNLIAVEFDVTRKVNSNNSQAYNVKVNNYNLWHQRLGHISKSKFQELKNKQMVQDVNHLDKVVPNDDLCEACINGKQARLPFEKTKNKSHIKRPLFIVHTDVCGPISPTTVNDKNYFVSFIDEFTHYSVTYLTTHKSDVFIMFKDYVAKSETHFNLKIVNLYCDNGREYLSNEMKSYCVEKGISYHLTVPHTPQLNGVAERMNRTITEKARAIINGASLGKEFWGEAVLTATYLINLTPTKALKIDKTPFELWHGKKPKLKYLKIFGSTIYVHNKIRKRKFDEKSWKGILVGFEPNPNGYKVWNTDTEKFVIVRDVIVDEVNYFTSRPVMKDNKPDVSDILSKSVEMPNKCDIDRSHSLENYNSDIEKSERLRRHKSNSKLDTLGPIDGKVMRNPKVNKSEIKTNKSNKSLVENNKENMDEIVQTENNKESTDEIVQIRRSERIKQKPPISYEETEISKDYLLCAQSVICKIPTSFEEVQTHADRIKWERAIQEEINSLITNKTWTLVAEPKDKNIIDCKWVFAIKNDEFGNPQKYKARLVARGFSQKYLVDYNETFAPVARISSFRFIVAFANQNDLLIHHMDVKTAFLNGILKEEIYMRVPEGVKSNQNQVCKLNKALYGLKQAARCWFEMFEKGLLEKGFQNSSGDRCIYILDRGNISQNIYVILYVDDLVIATANIETMQSFKNYLMNRFKMTDLKEIKLFLGIRVEKNNGKLTLDQNAYIKTVLEKFNMSDCKSVETPLPSKIDYIALNSDRKYEAPCRSLIGCLMYIMICTRPDLSTSINILSRYANKNSKELWQNLKRVLRYLKGTADIKLTYVKNNYNDLLCGYVDSDWGGSEGTDRKSTTGYLFKLYEQCTICWNTKKQASVASSSTEAEYMALYEAVKEALWLKSLATGIKIDVSDPIIIYEDNTGCISIANNPSSHKRSKHIDIKYHVSREQIEKNVIKLKFIPTGSQLADALTKPLSAVKFLEFRAGMSLE